MYNNILIFIAALFLFNASPQKSVPWLSPWLFLPVLTLLMLGFYLLARTVFFRLVRRGVEYQKIETLLSLIALCFFEAIVIICQPGYYLAQFPLFKNIMVLQSTGGLSIFVGLLVLMWVAGQSFSPLAGQNGISTRELISANLRMNLPIVLPWMLISSLSDLSTLLPFPLLHTFLNSPYGFILLAVLALLILPGLMRRLWGCSPMPEGEQRQQLQSLCQRLHCPAKLYLWPLHRGRALTAAVVGLIPGFRYILLTPALLEVMRDDELEAILAHEIGHVKKGHLLLSILIIAGFSTLITNMMEPVVQYLFQLGFLKNGLFALGFSRSATSAIISSVPALLGILLFFRFIFGYFLRNFERQADLYSVTAIGSAIPLITAFEKLARYNGGKKEEKNWHHFGLGERIACLREAERAPSRIRAHNQKIFFSLLCYVLITGVAVLPWAEKTPSLSSQQMVIGQLTDSDQHLVHSKSAELIDLQQRASWYRQIGDILVGKKEERGGLASYEKSLQLDPYNPVTLNNIAWLLVASEDLALRNPARALDLALEAVQWHPAGSFYDTLAAVYWANDMPEEALKAEEKARALDPGKSQYYQSQAWKFRTQTYQQELKQQKDSAEFSPQTTPGHKEEKNEISEE